jgi:photosystem II stability/assembly factor-like uncharacterized protein
VRPYLLAIDPLDPITHYAGSSDGISKSTDGGASWAAVNRGLRLSRRSSSAGDIGVIAIDAANPGTVYAVTEDGVYKTTNGGADWAPSSAGLPEELCLAELPCRPVARFGEALAIHPTNPNILCLALLNRPDVFKSTDGGATWTVAGRFPRAVGRLLIDPIAPDIIYAMSLDRGGVLKSTDGGADWQAINRGLPHTLVVDLVLARN